MKKRNIRFSDELIKGIEDYAIENCESNFTMAVRRLVKKALASEQPLFLVDNEIKHVNNSAFTWALRAEKNNGDDNG